MNDKAIFNRYQLAQEALTEGLEAINKGKRELALDCFSAASSYANDAYKLCLDLPTQPSETQNQATSARSSNPHNYTGEWSFHPRTVETKLFELRDRATFIPAIATLMESENPKERYLLGRAGYGTERRFILLTAIEGGRQAEYDSYSWCYEPWRTVHNWLEEHWDEVQTGAVLDGEFLRGETSEPKRSESEE